jgi:hypothetical protein
MKDMQIREEIREENRRLLRLLGIYMNQTPDFIEPGILRELTEECGLTIKEAYAAVLAAAIGLKIDENPRDKALYRSYFPTMIHHLDPTPYLADPYLASIRIPEKRIGKWEIRHQMYRPCEAFVFDDPILTEEGRIIPQIGFFTEAYHFPAVLELGREWMLITPNEINTMREVIEASAGRVLTYGLGLGYFAFMAARRREVDRVTVVERDPEAIKLFCELILPQIDARSKEKIEIVCDDAFSYAESKMADGKYDLVFTDIWHDPSDGVPLYRKMKDYEHFSPGSRFFYWIERTIRCYL